MSLGTGSLNNERAVIRFHWLLQRQSLVSRSTPSIHPSIICLTPPLFTESVAKLIWLLTWKQLRLKIMRLWKPFLHYTVCTSSCRFYIGLIPASETVCYQAFGQSVNHIFIVASLLIFHIGFAENKVKYRLSYIELTAFIGCLCFFWHFSEVFLGETAAPGQSCRRSSCTYYANNTKQIAKRITFEFIKGTQVDVLCGPHYEMFGKYIDLSTFNVIFSVFARC